MVTVRGELDTLGAELVAGALQDIIEGQGNLDVLLDVAGLPSIDPHGVQMVAVAAATSSKRRGRLRLAGATRTVSDTLIAAGLGAVITTGEPVA